MPASLHRLISHCDPLNPRFTPAQEDEDWRQSFDTFEAAYEHAEMPHNFSDHFP